MYGYQGFGQDQTQVDLLYGYIQQDSAYTSIAALQQMDPASRDATCRAMQARAASDSDASMVGKVNEACRSAGAGEQPTTPGQAPTTPTSHTGTYLLIGAVALIGIIALVHHKSK